MNTDPPTYVCIGDESTIKSVLRNPAIRQYFIQAFTQYTNSTDAHLGFFLNIYEVKKMNMKVKLIPFIIGTLVLI